MHLREAQNDIGEEDRSMACSSEEIARARPFHILALNWV
jgi:hypothetical protein